MSRLTKREKEILEHLKQEPMISQEELAAKLKISRSAAAVHISNLMRKGYILGRGYIFNERSGVLVIGKVWLEIEVDCDSPEKSSGRVKVSYGGIGYGLVSELSGFKTETTFLTVLGRDEVGDQVFEKLSQRGINTNYILRDSMSPTAKRVIVKNSQASVLEVNDSGIYDYLNQSLLETKEELIRTSQVVLIDGTLPFPLINFLLSKTEKHNVLTSIIGCSLNLLQQKNCFSYQHLFLVCSQEELERLAKRSVSGSDPGSVISICRQLVKEGLKAFIVLLRDQRVVLATKDDVGCIPVLPSQVVSSPLSLLAGIAAGLASGYGMRPAVRRALGPRLSGKQKREKGFSL
jgi:pseudouridine kinase